MIKKPAGLSKRAQRFLDHLTVVAAGVTPRGQVVTLTKLDSRYLDRSKYAPHQGKRETFRRWFGLGHANPEAVRRSAVVAVGELRNEGLSVEEIVAQAEQKAPE